MVRGLRAAVPSFNIKNVTQLQFVCLTETAATADQEGRRHSTFSH